MDTQEQLNVKQFSEVAQVSTRTTMNWLYAGKIPGAFKLVNRWRIPKDAIELMKSNPYSEGVR